METKRLCLRNVASNDAQIMYDYRNNDLCSRYQRDQIKDYAEILALIESRKSDVLCLERSALIAIALKDTNEMVGEVVVMPNDGTISLGYTISYRHHRKGYGYEALSYLLSELHERYPQCDFISFTHPDNEASMGLLLKLGYEDMGYLPSKESKVFGKWLRPDTIRELAEAREK